MSKVLIAAGDAELSSLMENWLCQEKHIVAVVDNGLDCWEHLNTFRYDLVLIDWDLPQLQGIDILKRFRGTGGTTPIILLSAHTTVADKELGFDAGANDLLTKPFYFNEFSRRVNNILCGRGSEAGSSCWSGAGNEHVLQRGDLIGTALASKYEFLEVLGEGGLGLVFKVRHPHLGRLLAVKMIVSPDTSVQGVARFEREARALCRLDHPNIVTIYDFGVTERKQSYMVLEFIDGQDLDTILEHEDHLSVEQTLEILIQVSDGLAHAHEMGVLHRDMKPGNIMLRRTGGRVSVVKVLDFGLAKLTVPESQNQIALTWTGQVCGSPPYMSPEQVRGKQVDERSDVYSVGCMLYEMLTGYTPFVSNKVIDIMLMHLEYQHEPLRCVRPDLDLPEDLESIVARALEKDPQLRYQSIVAFRDDLEHVQHKYKS